MVYHPTSRVLTALELLQTHAEISGPQIAERLEVDVRTVRRYIAMLQDLGIPIEATPGRHGGYRLRPGFKLPPLMFTDEEATALALGLLAVRRLGIAEVAPAVEGSLAKLERVLPAGVRARVQALRSALVVDLPDHEAPVAAGLVADLSQAAREGRRVRLRYQGGDGVSERTLDIYGVISHGGRWYAVAYCHLRAGLRIFRLDRALAAGLTDERFTPPEGFDSLAYLTRSIAEIPDRWDVLVVLETALARAQRAIPAGMAVLEPRADGVWMRSSIDDLGTIARVLVAADCPFRVVRPDELRAELRRLADGLYRVAADGESG